jgi:DNA polymerase
MTDDPRAELAKLAASLRAYLEWHQEAGTVGFPRRGSGGAATATAPAAEAPAHVPATAAASGNRPHADDFALQPAKAPGPSPGNRPHADDSAVPPAQAAGPAAARASAPARVQASVPGPPPAPASTSPAVSMTSTTPGEPPQDRRVRLAQIAQEVASCTRCALAATRTQTVFARGNPDAPICFIGEGPGADEDAQGLPFVGRAGQLLDRMIGAMGLTPERDCYICNIVKCRPPGNRRPEPEEMATCIPYLHEQIALVHPRVIVAMGNTAVAALLDTKMGISKVRGQWKLYRGHTLVMPTYHPSYLLRPSPQQTEAKRQAWQDLQLVMKELGLEGPQSTPPSTPSSA